MIGPLLGALIKREIRRDFKKSDGGVGLAVFVLLVFVIGAIGAFFSWLDLTNPPGKYVALFYLLPAHAVIKFNGPDWLFWVLLLGPFLFVLYLGIRKKNYRWLWIYTAPLIFLTIYQAVASGFS